MFLPVPILLNEEMRLQIDSPFISFATTLGRIGKALAKRLKNAANSPVDLVSVMCIKPVDMDTRWNYAPTLLTIGEA